MRGSASPARWVFVDSSAFAAFFLDREERHRDALAIAGMLARRGLLQVATNTVAIETHALILSRAGRVAAREALREIDTTIALVRVSEEDEQAGRAILDRYADKEFSLTDAISFAVMDRLRLRTAFAFDRHFAQYGLDVLAAE